MDEIEKVMKKLLNEQEERFNKIIKDEMSKIALRLDKVETNLLKNTNNIKNLEKEIGDIRDCTNFNEEIMDKKIWDVHSRIDEFGNTIYDLREKLRDQEDRNRRNNLRFDGIVEHKGETQEQLENKVKNILKNNLGIEKDIEFDRIHRTGRIIRGKPRTIVAKVHHYKEKVIIQKEAFKLKNTSVWINEDFSKETLHIRKNLLQQIKARKDNGEKGLVLRYDKIVKLKKPQNNNDSDK